MSTKQSPLWQEIGRCVAEFRQASGLRQDQVAATMRAMGCGVWTQAAVAGLETGRRKLELYEFPVLVRALAALTGRRISGADLIPESTEVVNDSVAIPLRELRGWLSRIAFGPKDIAEADWDFLADVDAFTKVKGSRRVVVWTSGGEADAHAARKLGVGVQTVALAAQDLWGKTLSAEREARLQERATSKAPQRTLQALRGHITRQLLRELEDDLERKGVPGHDQ